MKHIDTVSKYAYNKRADMVSAYVDDDEGLKSLAPVSSLIRLLGG